MIARIATFDNLPDDVDPQAVALLRETVRTAPGYVAGYHLHDPETGKAIERRGRRGRAGAAGDRPTARRA